MELNKHYQLKIQKEIQFYQIQLDDDLVDTNYFISKIDEGVKSEKAMSHKTNVRGEMTDWSHFSEDEKFLKLLRDVASTRIIKIPNSRLVAAWGIKMNVGNYTDEHNHLQSHFSGILYLNDVHCPIRFSEIETTIIPKKNTFLFFSGMLNHQTSPVENGVKYAIPFNIEIKKDWE